MKGKNWTPRRPVACVIYAWSDGYVNSPLIPLKKCEQRICYQKAKNMNNKANITGHEIWKFAVKINSYLLMFFSLLMT